ncbi:hypothetical protein [Tolypothrix sp. VBCCA 56010]|uniref:hypothetical protein n=1 Tax=Tolypothrix sp. VBCCA 56010 TaxID=3137731 RepID=UPI003D7CF179
MKKRHLYWAKHLKIVPFIAIICLLSGCVSYKSQSPNYNSYCQSNYQNYQNCQEEVDWVATFIQTSIFIFLVFCITSYIITSPSVLRTTRTLQQVIEPNAEDENKATYLNELLRLTGGFIIGDKVVFQEIRFHEKNKIYEICQKILLEDGIGADEIMLAYFGNYSNDSKIFKSAVFSLNMYVSVCLLASKCNSDLIIGSDFYIFIEEIITKLKTNPSDFCEPDNVTLSADKIQAYFNDIKSQL